MRDRDDKRLPAFSPSPWEVSGAMVMSKRLPGAPGCRARVGDARDKYPCAENDRRIMAAAPEMLGHLFALLVNYPKLGTTHEGFTVDEDFHITDWIDQEAQMIRETLKKAGVKL